LISEVPFEVCAQNRSTKLEAKFSLSSLSFTSTRIDFSKVDGFELLKVSSNLLFNTHTIRRHKDRSVAQLQPRSASMSPSSSTRSTSKSIGRSGNASSREKDGVRVVRVYEAGEVDDKNKLSREKKRKLDNSQEVLRPSDATEARVRRNPGFALFMASLGSNKESVAAPEE